MSDVGDLARQEFAALENGRRCDEDRGGCGQTFPLTEDYFHREGQGYRHICKLCRNKEEREKELYRRSELIKSIDEKAMGLLSVAVEEGGSALPHIAEVYELTMLAIGGPAGLARLFVSNLLAAPPGSNVRTKVLDRILTMGERATERGHTEKQTEQWTEEELYGRAAVVMKEMTRRKLTETRDPDRPKDVSNPKAIEANGPKTA